jgi:hypothetical protein
MIKCFCIVLSQYKYGVFCFYMCFLGFIGDFREVY